jgi:hypothetical protein
LRRGWQFGLAFPVRCAPQSRSTAPHDTDFEAVAELGNSFASIGFLFVLPEHGAVR